MGWLNFKKKAPSWNDLSEKQRQMVTQRIAKGINAMFYGPKYKLVNPTDEFQRERGLVEVTDEDGILNAYGRGKMLDLARNATRNSSTFSGILKQFDLNAIGTKGGKAIFDFDDADKIKDEFKKWTRDADFFDGLNFNTLLKLILKTYILGGDMVLLFDDGLIEDSGKLLIYEPDEIGNTTPEALKSNFGKYARQSLGRVYNGNGRFIGAIVSRSQRGEVEFDPKKSYFLHRDPDAPMFDNFWVMPRNVFRVAQGRGVSPMSTSLATILDLEDLCGYELAASKKNSQTLAQVLQDSNASNENVTLPSVFDKDTDFSKMTDEEIEEAVKQENASQVQTMTLERVNAAGCIYQVMPENYKMELLDTKHPNNNMPDFINWLATKSAAPFGLSEQFATFMPKGADFRANQLFSARSFEEAQKFLEQICDWCLYRWAIWANKRGLISRTPDTFISNVAWSWPKMDELDELQHQNAVEKKLKNMVGSYKEELGADWKEKLTTIKDEINWFKANGLPHPAYEMLSGGERTGAELTNKNDNEEIQ